MADFSGSASPEALYDAVWSTTYKNFWDEARLRNWGWWRNRFSGRLPSLAAAHAAIDEMLASLGDRFTQFKLPHHLEQDDSEAFSSNSPVRVEWLNGGIALVHLKSFAQHNTADALDHALRSVGDARGFILDLRGNGGGFLRQSNLALSLFMTRGNCMLTRSYHDGKYDEEAWWLGPDGFEVTTRDRRGNVIRPIEYVTRYRNIVAGRPLFVLVDDGTASAAEFFAATLRDHNLATLFGTDTAGKGIMQGTLPMPNGTALRLTSGTFLPPSGQFFGDARQTVYSAVQPHFRVDPRRDRRRDLILDVAWDHMLHDLDGRRAA